MGRNTNANVTKVAVQTTSSNSFKTTIPRNIMKEMGIKQGDYIHWMVVGSGRKKSIQIDTIDIK